MQILDKQIIQNAFRAAEVGGQTYDDTMAIIDDALFPPFGKVLTTTGVMNLFDAETPSDKNISDVIYAVNILSLVICHSMDEVPQSRLAKEAWLSAPQH